MLFLCNMSRDDDLQEFQSNLLPKGLPSLQNLPPHLQSGNAGGLEYVVEAMRETSDSDSPSSSSSSDVVSPYVEIIHDFAKEGKQMQAGGRAAASAVDCRGVLCGRGK